MRSRPLLICVCLFAWLRPAAAAVEPPKLRLSEVQDIAPEWHHVELTLDPDKDQFSGAIRIQVKVNRPSPIIWLNANQDQHAGGLRDGGRQNLERHGVPGGDDFLGLQLDSPCPPAVRRSTSATPARCATATARACFT